MSNSTSSNNFQDNGINFSKWYHISSSFSKYHKNESNVLLHLLTTPIGLIGALSLVRVATNSSSFIACLTMFYLLCLLAESEITNGVYAGTVFFSMIIVLACKKLNLNITKSIIFILLGYIIQDLSHYAFQEPTYQSGYSNGGHVSIYYYNYYYYIYYYYYNYYFYYYYNYYYYYYYR